MKKIVVLLALVGLSSFVNAQNKNIVSAINYFGYYVKDKSAGDLAEAKKYIDLATVHEETMNKAKMWSNRAQIYQAISDSKDEKVITNEQTKSGEIKESNVIDKINEIVYQVFQIDQMKLLLNYR